MTSWHNTKTKENRPELVKTLVSQYNEYVDEWNAWERGECEKYNKGEATDTIDFNHNGLISFVKGVKPQSLIFTDINEEYVYELVMKRDWKYYRRIGSFMKMSIEVDIVSNLWRHKKV